MGLTVPTPETLLDLLDVFQITDCEQASYCDSSSSHGALCHIPLPLSRLAFFQEKQRFQCVNTVLYL